MRFPPKDPAEVKLLRFEFATEIEAGRTIAVIDIPAPTVTEGVDPTPALVLEGTPTIDNANLYVFQRVKVGLPACDYQFRALATDNDGLKHLIVGTLPVRTGT